jgi:hypothetical protein
MLKKIQKNRTRRLLTALGIGFAFGFFLQKGGATEYEVIVNQLLLRDFTVLKIMLSAILTGMIGVYALASIHVIDLHPKPCKPRGIILGGLVFGAGFAILGYCPGTTAGAIGTGSIHALMGMIGMVIGAGSFAFLYPNISKRLDRKNLGNITLPDLLHTDPWIIILIMAGIIITALYIIETL